MTRSTIDCRSLFDAANASAALAIDATSPSESLQHQQRAIDLYERIVSKADVTEYLLLDAKPPIPREVFIHSYFNMGTLYKHVAQHRVQGKLKALQQNEARRDGSVSTALSAEDKQLFAKSINCFVTIIKVEFEHPDAISQIVSVYTLLTFFSQGNWEQCARYLQDALLFAPTSAVLHYNLGLSFHKQNKLELSIIHYKLAIELNTRTADPTEKKQMAINCYNGIASIFRSVKQWPESLHYLRKAERIDSTDPDINNQLGVVFTEMRRTDLAERCYQRAIKHYQKTFVSSDPTFLLAEVYLNFGHMHAYNGDNDKSIELYNESLKVCPSFSLPFQNKIMNLNYVFDQLSDKMYITQQHRLVNKLFKKQPGRYSFDAAYFDTPKIRVGIISGDFVDHPVSFFISTLLRDFDNTRFEVVCYSECVIDTATFNEQLSFKTIKNASAEIVADMIHNDAVHVLIDLAGHTAFNRLDVFALKPAPVQLTYVGYPFTTGLDEMDYRITDRVCDEERVAQPFYTEKLVFLPRCFLCYDPTVIKRGHVFTHIPLAPTAPAADNGFITIGCFNRVNKMTPAVTRVFDEILTRNPTVRFVFKTKALINTSVAQQFMSRFHKSVRNRIKILDCTLSHEDHLGTYNHVDVAIDTFPYSGTTTSCEALYMGVPVYTIKDDTYSFHPQNVTASILEHTHHDMKECIAHNEAELYSKISSLQQRPTAFWKLVKQQTRERFLSGGVCDKAGYMRDIQSLFEQLVRNKRHE